eukprot:2339420-Pleurochrysis_carterae.AAC.1
MTATSSLTTLMQQIDGCVITGTLLTGCTEIRYARLDSQSCGHDGIVLKYLRPDMMDAVQDWLHADKKPPEISRVEGCLQPNLNANSGGSGSAVRSAPPRDASSCVSSR